MRKRWKSRKRINKQEQKGEDVVDVWRKSHLDIIPSEH